MKKALKILLDRKNAFKSELKQLKQPKMGKHGVYNEDRILELEHWIELLERLIVRMKHDSQFDSTPINTVTTTFDRPYSYYFKEKDVAENKNT